MPTKMSMMAAACFAALLAGLAPAAAQTRTTLDIYVVDVEGGNATLFVSPSGQSVLIDTGNVAPEAAIRDAERIAAAAKDARLTQIDHLITTHWHGDHFGGMTEVAKRVPIRDYIDHGPNIQPVAAFDEFFAKAYPALYGAAKHTVAKPGDTVAVAGLDWRIVSAAGAVQKTPLAGGGSANASCAAFKPQDPDPTENAQSVGSIVTFGKFRVAHLGDLTWNNRKGAVPESMKTLFSSPGIEDVWQIHFSQLSGQEYTVPGMFIANGIDAPLSEMPVQPIAAPPPGPNTPPPPAHNGPAYWIKVSAQQDGTFTVTNARNGFAKTYGMNGRGTN